MKISIKKSNSKKGITLVEVVCAVCVLVVFVVGIITLLSTTHNSILKTSYADTKAAKVERVLDNLVTRTVNSKQGDVFTGDSIKSSFMESFNEENEAEYVQDGNFDNTKLDVVQFTAESCAGNSLNTKAVNFTATIYYTVSDKTEHVTYSSIAYLNGLDWGENIATP